jgi:predicted CopG family antitoxin
MSKLINVSDEVYEKLKTMKGSRSYSMVLKSLLMKKSNKEAILSFAGRGGIDEKEVEEMKKEWRRWSERYV